MTDTINAKVPLDFQLEHEQLNDRRALVQALLQRAMTPNTGQMVGQHYVAPNALGAIGAPLAQAMMAKTMQEQNRTQARELAERYKGIGASDEKYGHTPVTLKDRESGAPVSVLVGDRGNLKRMPDFAPATEVKLSPVGVAYDPLTTKPGTKLGEQYGPDEMVNGETIQREKTTGKAHQVANRPANVQVSAVNAGQKAGLSEYFKNAAGQVHAMGQQADSAQGLLSSLGTLRELHNAGIHSNVTSDMATTLANLAQQAGMKVDPNTLANTETYNSLITDLWQRNVAQYGGNKGVTAGEAEEIKKLTPLAKNSPRAREQLFTIYENAAKRSINRYQQANKSFAAAAAADDPRLFQIPTDIEGSYVPPAGNNPNPKVTTPGKPSVSNW